MEATNTSAITPDQVKQLVRDELKRILDAGLMYTENKNVGAPAAEPSQNLVRINELTDGTKKVDAQGKITSIQAPREIHTEKGPTQTTYATLDDGTGTIKLSLWGQHTTAVKESDKVIIQGGYVSSYKGELQLNVGKWGKLIVNGEEKAQ
jgi:replication factor A1